MKLKGVFLTLIVLLTLTFVVNVTSATFLEIHETSQLLAADGHSGSHFGTSIDIDGNTAVIGAPYTHGNSYKTGAAYVYERIDGQWSQSTKLVADDGAFWDWFGTSVAIHGNWIIVGAPLSKGPDGTNHGAAYIYMRKNDGAWVQAAKLTTENSAEGSAFGYSVDISNNTAVVGAWTTTVGEEALQGATYVFTVDNAQWSQTAELLAVDGNAYDRFGADVAIDRNTIIVGANDAEVGANLWQGAAYVFQKQAGVWVQTAKLIAENGQDVAKFGESVAISGNTVVVGAWRTTVNGNEAQGAAFVFERRWASPHLWQQTAILTASDGAAVDRFGAAVIEGPKIVIGAPTANIGGYEDVGAAYIFVRSRYGWREIVKLTPSNPESASWFGGPAISERNLMIGSGLADVNGAENQGIVYVFDPVQLVQRLPTR